MGVMDGAAATLLPMLFGDLSIDRWPAAAAESDPPDELPWSAFVQARDHLAAGDQDLAIRAWASVAQPGPWESRHTLQAWHFLRAAGVRPDESIAHQVLGVVAEISVDGAHDALAAYRIGGVRYLNHAGPIVVVEDGPADLAVRAGRFLDAAQAVASRIGPWTEPELPDLPVGHSRFTMLTPAGPHLGQGPDDVLQADPMAQPLFATATDLFLAVVELRPPGAPAPIA